MRLLLATTLITTTAHAAPDSAYQQMVDGWEKRSHITIFIDKRCFWGARVSSALRAVDPGARPRSSESLQGKICVGDKVNLRYLFRNELRRKSVSVKRYTPIAGRNH